jgi:hypothetical protein
MVNNELGRLWKEAAVFYLKVAFYPIVFLQELRKSTKMSGRNTRFLGRNVKFIPPECEAPDSHFQWEV